MVDKFDLAIEVLRILEKSMSKPKARKSFSGHTKRKVLASQNQKCKQCKTKLDAKDFDHIDGDSSNNSLDNCQALCPNCHAKKTRKNKSKNMKISQTLKKLRKYAKLRR